MNDHLDKIRIIESRRAALERRVVENPFGRPEPPQQPAERAAILRQAGSAALAMKIVLVPIASFLFRRGRTRSEEHTSELQSLMRISYAVFCLKKKKQQIKIIIHTIL